MAKSSTFFYNKDNRVLGSTPINSLQIRTDSFKSFDSQKRKRQKIFQPNFKHNPL